MLTLNQISKSYFKPGQTVEALAEVSISVQGGEFLAIQGHSGSGKTTLLLSAGGLLRPDSGEVILADQNIYQLDEEARAKFRAQNIGFVFQQYHLVPYLTVFENVFIPNLAIPVKNARERGQALIRQFGLTARINHLPAELSAGEKQRTALARALFHQPKLLFADEITGNLDQKNTDIVLEYLQEFTQNGGAVVLVTHDSKAALAARRTLILEKGRVILED